MRMTCVTRVAGVACLALSLTMPIAGDARSDPPAPSAPAEKSAAPGDSGGQITRQGLKIDFSVRPASAPPATGAGAAAPLMALQTADLAFTIADAVRNEPVRGLSPGAWIDKVADTPDGKATGPSCKDRVGLYFSGRVGLRPLIDANGYLILTLNRDSTISVIDPNVVVGGTSSVLYDQVILSRPGEDWVLGTDRKKLFVTMPRADAVAVVDADEFTVIKEVRTGAEPTRAALQPDGRFVWIGNNANGQTGGVSVIDTHTLDVVATLETGKGHHEIAFSDDDRLALVTNRKDGTATVIDVAGRTILKQIPVGKSPVAAVFSARGKAFYVADGEAGVVHVIAGETLRVEATIQAKPGLGPMQFTPDGRWLLMTNAATDEVLVVDTSKNAVVHTIAITGRPYQLSTTRAFAYVRTLDSERVSMITLSSLGKETAPIVTSFIIGNEPPAKAGRLPIAASVVEAAGEAGVVGVDPAEGTLIYYMEGMTAPMGTFRSLGGKPRGVLVVDRFLAETTPGRYATRIQVPAAGRYEAAFVLDSPKVVHCFTFDVNSNPHAKQEAEGPQIRFLSTERRVPTTEPWRLRFRLVDGSQPERPLSGLTDVQVTYFRAPGHDRSVVTARDAGDGVYEASLSLLTDGAWYVYVSSVSGSAPPGKFPFATVRATSGDVAGTATPGGPAPRSGSNKNSAER